MQKAYDYYSELEDLGESVFLVSSSGVFVDLGESCGILRYEKQPCLRLDHAGSHEDLPHPQGSGEDDHQVDQVRFDLGTERTPAFKRLEERFRQAALEEAKHQDRWLRGVCPVCERNRAYDGEVAVRWTPDGRLEYSCASCCRLLCERRQWKKDIAKQVLQPIPESTWDYLDEPG